MCSLFVCKEHGEYQLVPLLLHLGTRESLFDFGLEFVHAAGNRKDTLSNRVPFRYRELPRLLIFINFVVHPAVLARNFCYASIISFTSEGVKDPLHISCKIASLSE